MTVFFLQLFTAIIHTLNPRSLGAAGVMAIHPSGAYVSSACESERSSDPQSLDDLGYEHLDYHLLTPEEQAAFDAVPREYAVMLSDTLAFLIPLIAGICLAVLANRFLTPRWQGRLGAWLLPAALFYSVLRRTRFLLPEALLPLELLFCFVLLFAAVSLFYRGTTNKKLYLCFTLEALTQLCILLANYTKVFIDLLLDTLDISMSARQLCLFLSDPWAVSSAPHELPHETFRYYLDWAGTLTLPLICALLIFSAGKLCRGVRHDLADIQRRELLFLFMPAFTGIILCSFTDAAGILLRSTIFASEMARYGLMMQFLVPFLALCTVFCILYAHDIYQKLLSYAEDRNRAAILESQVNQMQEHIRDIEQLYTGIRSMKHDMQNYLFDIKSLLTLRGIDVDEPGSELHGYFSGIGQSLSALNYSFHTGNPVTDVVLNGKYQQAKSLGARFDSDFLFPKGFGANAFDISIILNNALNNALDACKILLKQDPAADAFVGVSSQRRNNMVLIQVENSFFGQIPGQKENGLPKTSKDDTWNHGLGLQNVKQCAEKYFGGLSYTCADGLFRLTVMLQEPDSTEQIVHSAR